MTQTTVKTPVTPSQLTASMINMGYNADLSAPLIANTYLRFKATGEVLPRSWEASTIKDVQTCYNRILNGVK